MALGLGGAMAIGGGAQLLSGMLGQDAADKERKYWEKQARQRRKFLRPYRRSLERYSEELKRLPAHLRRQREGRMASLANQQVRRLRQNLGQAGVTGGAAIAQQAQQKQMFGMEGLRQREILGEQQNIQGMRARQLSMATGLTNAMYPSAGQSAAGAAPQTYFDPTAAFSNAVGLYGYGRGGGGTNPYEQQYPVSGMLPG